jgi:uncharacterized membrane protein
VKSCFPSAAVEESVDVVLAFEVLLVFEFDAGGVVGLLAVLVFEVVVVVVVFVVLLALAGAVDEQAAVTSNAAVKAPRSTILFIYRSRFR